MSANTIESESNSKPELSAPPTKDGRKAAKKAKPTKKAPTAKKPAGKASDRTNKTWLWRATRSGGCGN